MYLIQLGPVVYEKKGGAPFTLTEAIRETYGIGGARILRTDGTVVVTNAGGAAGFTHAPTGRYITRRKVVPRRVARMGQAMRDLITRHATLYGHGPVDPATVYALIIERETDNGLGPIDAACRDAAAGTVPAYQFAGPTYGQAPCTDPECDCARAAA